MVLINPLVEGMVGHSELRATRELVRAPAIPARAPPSDERQDPESSLVASVLQLQQAAGNRAVTSALTASRWATAPELPLAIQREPADGGGNASSGALLAAVWDAQVVLPLARAAERLARDKPDLKGARPDLEAALGTIATLRKATPAEDPNYVRLQIVERRARGPLDLIDHRLGRSAGGHPLENGMIEVRSEASELGPMLEHMPDQQELLQQGTGAGSTASTSQAEAPASGPSDATAAAAPEKAPVETPASATSGGSDATSADAGGPSIADVWNILVVGRLWSGQQTLEETPYIGYFNWSVAIGRVQDFYNATPSGHPNRLPLLKLFTDAMQVQDLMGELARDFAGDPLADRGEEAYSTAVAMSELITGQPAATSETPETAEGAEPDFTWERERPPMKNDTELERP